MPQTPFLLAQSLPEGGMIPLFVALGAGIMLWLAGVKIVRFVFLVLGGALGGFVGAVLMPLTALPAFNLGPVHLTPGFTGLIVGGVFGALLALLALRLVITFTAAVAFAVAGAMGALVFLHFNPTAGSPASSDAALVDGSSATAFDISDDVRREAAERATDALNDLAEQLNQDQTASGLLEDLNTEENRQRLADAAERSRDFLHGVSQRIKAEYDARPGRDKLVILSATTAGLALGLLLGVTAPNRSSAMVTSLFGSAMWLGAGVALIRANAEPDPGFINQPPLNWAVVWGVATVVGMVVQFGLIKRRGHAHAHHDEPAGED